jgi:signal peptide peptidase SppA
VNITLLQKQPWLIEPEALGAMMTAARTFFDKNPELPNPSSSILSIDDGVAVISIRGPMLSGADAFDRLILGATDTQEIIEAVEEATKRPDAHALFLDIDSPGGTVNGIPELAQTVASASRQKQVYAFSSGQMCSAAYWIASQANAIYATPSARIGSIGVILPVIDSSAAFEQAGLKVEVFAAGKFKSAGTPGTSLTDEQRDWLRAEVEETAAEFRAAVLARGRKIPDEAMEGQTFSGRRAMRFNLSGVVSSRAEAIERLRSYHVPAKSESAALDLPPVDTKSPTMTEQPTSTELTEARPSISKLEADASARESLLTEATSRINELQAQVDLLKSEHGIEAEAHSKTRAELEAAKQSLESFKSQLEEANARSRELEARTKMLEAEERDIEKRAALRAAFIISQTGTQSPANVTPQGENRTAALLEQFRAVRTPAEQTIFWQSLSPGEQAQILSQSTNL